jgi:hypothetical protein
MYFFFVILYLLRGRGEAWSSRLPVTQEVAGSNPVVPAIGQIAQSVEHLSEKQGVGSSILPLATKKNEKILEST